MFETGAVSVLADLALADDWPPPDLTEIEDDAHALGGGAARTEQRRPSVLDGVRLGWQPPKHWPVAEPLRPLLPGGLHRGSTVVVSGSASLLLALLGAASHAEALIALVGLPTLSTEPTDPIDSTEFTEPIDSTLSREARESRERMGQGCHRTPAGVLGTVTS